MKVETLKTPIRYAGWSLIGIGGKPPHSWGNYFWIMVNDERVRVLNMWLENLRHAEIEYLQGDGCQIRLYRDAGEAWCLIDDERIPAGYYYNTLCFTGGRPPTPAVATDAFAYLGDPDNEVEQYTNPVTYWAKKGWEYNPATGSRRKLGPRPWEEADAQAGKDK